MTLFLCEKRREIPLRRIYFYFCIINVFDNVRRVGRYSRVFFFLFLHSRVVQVIKTNDVESSICYFMPFVEKKRHGPYVYNVLGHDTNQSTPLGEYVRGKLMNISPRFRKTVDRGRG